jgi:hypothetical protein
LTPGELNTGGPIGKSIASRAITIMAVIGSRALNKAQQIVARVMISSNSCKSARRQCGRPGTRSVSAHIGDIYYAGPNDESLRHPLRQRRALRLQARVSAKGPIVLQKSAACVQYATIESKKAAA